MDTSAQVSVYASAGMCCIAPGTVAALFFASPRARHGVSSAKKKKGVPRALLSCICIDTHSSLSRVLYIYIGTRLSYMRGGKNPLARSLSASARRAREWERDSPDNSSTPPSCPLSLCWRAHSHAHWYCCYYCRRCVFLAPRCCRYYAQRVL